MFCSLLNQFCYQCQLIRKGLTTNEDIREKWSEGNPFDKGCDTNCKTFCCLSKGRSVMKKIKDRILSKGFKAQNYEGRANSQQCKIKASNGLVGQQKQKKIQNYELT